ncbi:MAG TPA: hypothetical protein VIB79_16485 [Candidatus Binatia bacterium]
MFSSRKILIPDVPPKRRTIRTAPWFDWLRLRLSRSRQRLAGVTAAVPQQNSARDHLISSARDDLRKLRD